MASIYYMTMERERTRNKQATSLGFKGQASANNNDSSAQLWFGGGAHPDAKAEQQTTPRRQVTADKNAECGMRMRNSVRVRVTGLGLLG